MCFYWLPFRKGSIKNIIFKNLSVTRGFDCSNALPGDIVQLSIKVTNRKILPVTWMHIESILPVELKLVNETVKEYRNKTEYLHNIVMSILPYQRVNRKYKVKCAQRGYYKIRMVEVKSTDMFGDKSYSIKIDAPANITVYPRFADLSGLQIPAGTMQGDVVVKRWILDDPVMIAGVRDYSRGDSIRDINWKITAKRQKLMVNQHDFTSDKKIMLILDVDDFDDIWSVTNELTQLVEQAIEVTASIADIAINEGLPVGFATNALYGGNRENAVVQPNTGDDQLGEILNCLGRIQYYKKYSFHELMQLLERDMEWGTELIMVVPSVRDEFMVELQLLKHRKVTVVSMSGCEAKAVPQNCDIYVYDKVGEPDAVI